MIRRSTFIITGTVILGLAAAGISLAAAGAFHSSADFGAQPVTSVIILEPHLPGEVFAPPPANASPALTAHQAAVRGEGLRPGAAIPPGVSVQLGLFSLPVGPASGCRNDCHGDTFVHGIAYSSYQVLVYGFSRSECPHHPRRAHCTQWDFINADTGRYIGGIIPHLSEPLSPRPSPST